MPNTDGDVIHKELLTKEVCHRVFQNAAADVNAYGQDDHDTQSEPSPSVSHEALLTNMKWPPTDNLFVYKLWNLK